MITLTQQLFFVCITVAGPFIGLLGSNVAAADGRRRRMGFAVGVIGAVVCIAGGVWFGFRRPSLAIHVRPIYEELGILAPAEETNTPVA